MAGAEFARFGQDRFLVEAVIIPNLFDVFLKFGLASSPCHRIVSHRVKDCGNVLTSHGRAKELLDHMLIISSRW